MSISTPPQYARGENPVCDKEMSRIPRRVSPHLKPLVVPCLSVGVRAACVAVAAAMVIAEVEHVAPGSVADFDEVQIAVFDGVEHLPGN